MCMWHLVSSVITARANLADMQIDGKVRECCVLAQYFFDH